MEVVDILHGAKSWLSGFGRFAPSYDSHAELAARRGFELVVGEGKCALYRNAAITDSLDAVEPVASGGSVEDACQGLPARAKVTVSLDSALCFSYTRLIPRRALGRVAQILAIDLARTTPFSPEQVMTGWFERHAVSSAGQMDITHVIIRRDIVAGVAKAIRGRNAQVRGITVREGLLPAWPIALTEQGDAFGRPKLRRAQGLLAAGVMTLCLGLASLAVVLWSRQDGLLGSLAARTAVASKHASELQDKLQARKRAQDAIAALVQRQRITPDPVVVITELTKLLPDNVSLQGLAIARDQIVIDGLAAAPESLISTIEASPQFKAASFLSPVIKGPNETRSHFSIRMELEPSSSQVAAP